MPLFPRKSVLSSGYLVILFGFWFCRVSVVEGGSFEEDITLTGDQKNALEKFKREMWDQLPHDYMKKDIYLIKWLRTKQFDVPAAVQFLSENLEWREKEGMDGIQDEDWSDYLWEYPYWIEGSDKKGRPIIYLHIGITDIRKTVITDGGERYARYVNKVYEEGCTLVRTLGEKYHNITRGQLIIDMDGFNLAQHACPRCLPLIIKLFTSYEQHFPECADKIIIIRNNQFLQRLYGIVSPFLSEATRKALRYYGTNRKEWMEGMAEDFDFDQLPPGIGGTKIYKGMEKDY